MAGIRKCIEKFEEEKNYLVPLSLFVLFFLFFISKMSPLYSSNEWSDINIYETIGKSIAEGKKLYIDVFDHKGPLIFLIYALGYKLSSHLFWGMFVILGLFWLLVLIHLYFSLRQYLSGFYSVLILGLTLYFSLNYSHTGGSPEEFILLSNLFLISVCLRIANPKRPDIVSRFDVFILGALFAVILLLKFNLGVFYVFILGGILINYLLQKRYKHFILYLSYLFLGFVIMFGGVCFYLYSVGALEETYNIYVILNKKMVVGYSLVEMIRLGGKRVIELFKYHALGSTIVFIGGFVFPFLYIRVLVLRIAFLLGVCSLFGIIYFSGMAHFYYTLPLYALIPVGLLTIFDRLVLLKRFHLERKACLISLGLLFVLSIAQVGFWGLSKKQLLREEGLPGVNYQFAEIINQSENPSLLVLSFGDAVNLFTLCEIFPDQKYFSILNVSYDVYPDLRESQKRYIENREVEFIVLNEGDSFFNTFEPLTANYRIVDVFEGYEEFQNVKIPKITFLYQRK